METFSRISFVCQDLKDIKNRRYLITPISPWEQVKKYVVQIRIVCAHLLSLLMAQRCRGPLVGSCRILQAWQTHSFPLCLCPCAHASYGPP